MVDATSSYEPGRQLRALGRGRAAHGGSAAGSSPGAAQCAQMAQPGTRDRGINHLAPVGRLPPPGTEGGVHARARDEEEDERVAAAQRDEEEPGEVEHE